MEDLFRRHVTRLEEYSDKVGLSDCQKIELYQIAREFFEDSGIIYSLVFASNYRWPEIVEKKTREAREKTGEIARELMRIEDSIGKPNAERKP